MHVLSWIFSCIVVLLVQGNSSQWVRSISIFSKHMHEKLYINYFPMLVSEVLRWNDLVKDIGMGQRGEVKDDVLSVTYCNTLNYVCIFISYFLRSVIGQTHR